MRDDKGRFLKGRDTSLEPIEYKIKKMYSLEKMWKERDDYIADLIKEAPYIYNSWRGIRFTDKGKLSGNCESWNDFKTFYNDVRPTYKKGLVLRRLESHKPFAKDNFIWVTLEEAVLLKSNLVWLEFEGKNLTMLQWAKEVNSTLCTIRNRYYSRDKQKYSVKEVIYGRPRRRGIRKPKNHTETNIRSKASKMISSYKHHDYKNGVEICDIDIDWMIDNILLRQCYYCEDSLRVGCDRIDNSRGHIKTNVVPCCIECNTVRNDNFSVDEMRILGKTIKYIKDERNNTQRIA